jgi:hypothetical protein
VYIYVNMHILVYTRVYEIGSVSPSVEMTLGVPFSFGCCIDRFVYFYLVLMPILVGLYFTYGRLFLVFVV